MTEEYERRSEGYTATEDRYSGYTVRDPSGEKIGKVEALFLDENDQPEYIGVKMGFLGTKSTLIPMDACTVDEDRGFVEVSRPKSAVKEGPAFDDDKEITPELKGEVRSYYGLQTAGSPTERGAYGDYYGEERAGGESEGSGVVGPGMRMGDIEGGEFRGHAAEEEGVAQPGSDLEDVDELRVRRSEEELRAGTREREAGAMRIRKRVRTDRERLEVPTRREEVVVERVPVEGEASEAQIGDDEISIPVTEEEVVAEKRSVLKEEVRVRKDVVEDTEVVEEDVRSEEIEVEDDTERGRGI
jgi:uncharacterized protein (TIGR02271 family)